MWSIAHADREMMAFAIGHANIEHDKLNSGWDARAALAERQYVKALDRLRELSETKLEPEPATAVEETLIWAYALTGQMDLAKAALAGLDERGTESFSYGVPRVSLELATGSIAEADRIRAINLRLLEQDSATPILISRWTSWFLMELGNPRPAVIAALEESFARALPADLRSDPRVEMLQLMVAASMPDHPWDRGALASAFGENRAMAEGIVLQRNHDHAGAAAAFERAAQASPEGRFMLNAYFVAARAHRIAGNSVGVIATCSEVIEPRLFQYAWGALVGDCLKWTAEAAAKLQDKGRAEKAGKKLRDLGRGD